MQSRRDQIQAYSFVVGRLNSGVLRVDIDSPDQPVARTSKGITMGLLLALVAGVVVAIYGFVVPGGNTGWRQPGAFVIVEDSGARFLYADGALHPVLNETSAKLVAGSQMAVRTVDSASLKGARLGQPFGIVGAPDALPANSALSGQDWSTCALPQADDGTGTGSPQVVLRIGMPAPGGGLDGGQAVLTGAPDGSRYLLWQGRRLTVGARHGESQALGYGATVPVPVPAAFLDAIPAGPDLSTPAVAGLGTPGPVLAGLASRVGQLFTDSAGRHYVLTRQGLDPLTPTLYALFRGDPEVQDTAYGGGVVDARTIGPSDLAQHVGSGAAAQQLAGEGALLPASPPRATGVADGQAVCVDLRSQAGAVSSSVRVAAASAVRADGLAPTTGSGITPSCHPAGLVAVRPGAGVLVGAAPAGGGAALTPYLVTDDGVKYPIPSAGVVTQLGYSPAASVTLPTTVLGLLPTGPSLDPAVLAHGGIVAPPSTGGSCAN